MRDEVKKLEGSRRRDRFKFWHKNELPGSFYAIDLDFVLVRFGDDPKAIVAILDYKHPEDDITATEARAYQELLLVAPVFIIEGAEPYGGPFDIWQVTGFNYDEEIPEKCLVERGVDAAAFQRWEQGLRDRCPAA